VQEVPGSNPGSPTKGFHRLTLSENCQSSRLESNWSPYVGCLQRVLEFVAIPLASLPLKNPPFPTIATYLVDSKGKILVGLLELPDISPDKSC
jgi:hypothetical protein